MFSDCVGILYFAGSNSLRFYTPSTTQHPCECRMHFEGSAGHPVQSCDKKNP